MPGLETALAVDALLEDLESRFGAAFETIWSSSITNEVAYRTVLRRGLELPLGESVEHRRKEVSSVSIRKRIKALEDHFRDRGPTLQEVQEAWGRITGRARAKLRDDSVDSDQQDHDTVTRWQRATGVDLEGEAQKAKQKLLDVGRRNT